MTGFSLFASTAHVLRITSVTHVLAGVLVATIVSGRVLARPIDELPRLNKNYNDENIAEVFNKDIRDTLRANPDGLLFWEVEENRGTQRRRLNPDTDKQVTHVAQFVVEQMNERSVALGGVECELAHVLNPCLFMERAGSALYRFRFQLAVIGAEDHMRHVLRSYEATVHEDKRGKLVVMQERMIDSSHYLEGWHQQLPKKPNVNHEDGFR